MGRASAAVGGYPVAGRSLWRVGGWAPLFVWDFTQQSPGALVLPTGLSFARASSGHSVQTGTNGLIVGGAIASNDIGRIGRLLDAHSYGLFIEPSRTNVVTQSRTPQLFGPGSWASTTTGQSDAAGGTSAVRVTTTSGGTGRYQAPATLRTGAYTASQWVRQGAGSGSYQLVQGNATVAAVGGTAPVAWTRIECLYTFAGEAAAFLPGDGRNFVSSGGVAAGARDFVLDFMQQEAGRYPTSAIVTSGSEATRAAERLTIDSTRATASIVGGRVGIYLRFRAIAALSALNYASEGFLLRELGGNFNVRVYANSLQLEINGPPGYQSITGSSAINWSAGDLVEFYLEFGAGKSVAKWRVNGVQSTASWSVRDDVFPALSASPSGIDILNNTGAWHTPGVLEVVQTYVPGRAPF